MNMTPETRAVLGAIKDCINQHGVIDHSLSTSAAKRILGALKLLKYRNDNTVRPHERAIDISHLPLGDCVYMLFFSDPRRNSIPIYIGKGSSIGRAVQSAKEKKAEFVWIIPCDSTDEAGELERDLIEKHKPPFNYTFPTTKTRKGGLTRAGRARNRQKIINELDYEIALDESVELCLREV